MFPQILIGIADDGAETDNQDEVGAILIFSDKEDDSLSDILGYAADLDKEQVDAFVETWRERAKVVGATLDVSDDVINFGG